jgi:hypothetical protein
MELPMSALRSILAVTVVSIFAAACQPVAAPDPALQTASLSNLQDRVRFTCVRVQANLQNTSAGSVSSGCSCYARRTIRALDKEELASYRDTGLFNASARQKALKAIDTCGLKRPV